MDVSKLTKEQLELVVTALMSAGSSGVKDIENGIRFFEKGKAYIFRTVTHINIGRVKDQDNVFLVLEDVSWIPDVSSWSKCLKEGESGIVHVEPFAGDVVFHKHSLIDAAEWTHSLPNKVR